MLRLAKLHQLNDAKVALLLPQTPKGNKPEVLTDMLLPTWEQGKPGHRKFWLCRCARNCLLCRSRSLRSPRSLLTRRLWLSSVPLLSKACAPRISGRATSEIPRHKFLTCLDIRSYTPRMHGRRLMLPPGMGPGMLFFRALLGSSSQSAQSARSPQ